MTFLPTALERPTRTWRLCLWAVSCSSCPLPSPSSSLGEHEDILLPSLCPISGLCGHLWCLPTTPGLLGLGRGPAGGASSDFLTVSLGLATGEPISYLSLHSFSAFAASEVSQSPFLGTIILVFKRCAGLVVTAASVSVFQCPQFLLFPSQGF